MPDGITKQIARFIEPFRVSPGSSVKLAKDFDPAFKAGIQKKKAGVGVLNDGISLLSEYQQRLAADATHGVVVVLQALDAAGKDGTIRHVMSGVNPQGVRVESFKNHISQRARPRLPAPLPDAASGTWRDRDLQPIPLRGGASRTRPSREPRRREACGRGSRATCLEAQVPRDQRMERYLSDNGFRMVKLFLNLSKEEQRTRFLRRIDLPEHNWKFSSHDLQERRYWDAYQDAFSEMFTHTSTEWAPWYIIPADRKWFARVAAAAVIAHALRSIRSTRRSARTRSATSSAPRANFEAEAPNGAARDPFEAPEC